MGSAPFANESPAYAVLYRPSDEGWSARIIDLDSHIVLSSNCSLTKASDAYAVLYTPQSDGRWSAEIVDLPGCNSTRPEIAQARIAAKALAQKLISARKESGEPVPPPTTLCHYTRPTDFQLNQGRQATVVDEVARAVASMVAQHRDNHGTTPRASSVCGYVSLSSEGGEDEPAPPE